MNIETMPKPLCLRMHFSANSFEVTTETIAVSACTACASGRFDTYKRVAAQRASCHATQTECRPLPRLFTRILTRQRGFAIKRNNFQPTVGIQKPRAKQAGNAKLLIVCSLALICLLTVALLVVRLRQLCAPAQNPLMPPAMAAAQYASHDVVGDLGGVPVNIPSYFANFVEYEGDPGWGPKRKGPVPERTYQSKLTSFGYYTRFPDMAGRSSPAMWKDIESYSSGVTPWISVGVNTGSSYPGDGFLDRRAGYIGKSADIIKHEKYEQLPGQEHGLTVYAAAGVDPRTNTPYREDTFAHDLFLHREKNSRVDTYIDCSNRNVRAPPCRHDFSLEPHMNAQIYVTYRRSLLPQWQEIQQAVRQQILGFKVPPAEPVTSTR